MALILDIADAVSELDEPPGHDLVVPDHATQEQWDEHYRNAPHHSWPKHADLLRTTPRSLTPDLRAVPEGEGEQWVDVTKDDRKTTGPDQIVKDAAAIARWPMHRLSIFTTNRDRCRSQAKRVTFWCSMSIWCMAQA